MLDTLVKQTEKLSGINIKCPKCGSNNVYIERYSIQSEFNKFSTLSMNPIIHTIYFEYRCFNCFTIVNIKTEMEKENND